MRLLTVIRLPYYKIIITSGGNQRLHQIEEVLADQMYDWKRENEQRYCDFQTIEIVRRDPNITWRAIKPGESLPVLMTSVLIIR